MAKVLQHRRGTTAEHANFTGAEGEVTVDTTDKRLVVHDGSTKGGVPMAKKSEIVDAKSELQQEIVDAKNELQQEVVNTKSELQQEIGNTVTSLNGHTGDVTPDQTGCLPLIGGTLTGAIGFEGIGYLQCKNSTSNGIQIYGANAFADGAFLGIYGKDHASRPGWVYANASDGASSTTLIGKPDGALTWGGKNVAYITNSWKSGNGENWYRKYDDGFIEQGGIIWFEGVSGTITYHTAHKAPPVVEYNTNGNHAEYTLSSVSTTNFVWKCNEVRSGYLYWRAAGY